MKNTSWKDVAELIGMTAIVLSLLFVGLQIRQSQQLATEERINNSNERQNAIRELISANPDVWEKACLGEPLESVERILAAKMFDAWLDHVVGEYELRTYGVRQSDDARKKVVEEIAAQLWRYPGLSELSASRSDWQSSAVETQSGSGELGRLIRARIKELESSGIKREGDIAWCGRT